ncbi:hypothetical protein GIB67_002552 [Kingdonia uniflora]|uniref:Rhamnogalacturonan lyase domain-containing protein n=1 Tax=Kingdonia uniflora TaxID=39325 RepID=A0A7J7N8S2_9MAGN|nr:hypothetical protein GIB67_002552 [Kingdonia uniflora]
MSVMVEDETIAPIIKKDLPKGLWEDEDDVKKSQKDDDEPSYFGFVFLITCHANLVKNLSSLLVKNLLAGIHALSTLQAKAKYEIGRAQKIILAKNEELHVAEEGLSGLKEVLIEYWGNGHTLEVSGNFNGWHHPIEMEPNSSSTMDSTESRRRPGAKILKSRVVEKGFWTNFHLSQFNTRWGRSAITLGGCQSPGSEINLDVLVYEPPRDSPTLWEIGAPDRSAKGFYVPDPNPNYVNTMLTISIGIEKHMVKTRIYRFGQYGLWKRHAELYPDDDFIFKIGINDYHKDWLFAQVPRKKLETDGYKGTTWQIIFKLDKMNKKGTYKLLSYELHLHLPLLLNCRFE